MLARDTMILNTIHCIHLLLSLLINTTDNLQKGYRYQDKIINVTVYKLQHSL